MSGSEFWVGMQVYGTDNVLIGPVEKLAGDGIIVRGQFFPRTAIGGIVGDRVYLQGLSANLLTTRRTGQLVGPTDLGDIKEGPAEDRVESSVKAGWLRPRGAE